MGKIKLTGLKSGVPIGFMAALGTFRQAERIPELGAVKLAWTPHGGQWCAVLDTSEQVEADGFIQLLLSRLNMMAERPEFAWAKAVKSATKKEYLIHAGHALNEASADDHDLVDWFAAFASELVLKKDAETVESTPLDMTVARQQFLADALWLTRSLAAGDDKSGTANAASLSEALFGPWKYSDNQHSLGWDPTTILMGAFTPKAPTAMPKAGVRAAVWLAMESLPFFPCVYDRDLATRAFIREKRQLSFQWPIWTMPLSVVAIETLLSQAPNMEPAEWKARGVSAVYSSDIFKPNKYLTSFQSAVLLG